MWPFSSHRTDSLKSRLILSAVVPGLVAALLLVALLGWSLASQQGKQQQESWRSILSLLVAQAEPALQHGDNVRLARLAQETLALPDVRSITFRNRRGEEIAHAGAALHPVDLPESPLPRPQVFTREDRVQHLWPLRTANTHELLGWVDVEFSNNALQLLLYRHLAILALVLSIVTCLALVLASFMFRRTMSGFRLMQRELERVRHGDFTIRISPSDNEELNHLVETLNETIATFARHQRELQEHINQSTQDLRETLETVEIQNIELDLARKEALNASKIKSEFLANTSHEIRTPLNGIIGFTRLLLKDCKDNQQREYLITIQQSSENLLNLINDILDLSKIEAGKLVLDYESFDLRQLTEETLQILAPSAHDKGLELAHLVNGAVPHRAFGDAARLKQILTNLIGNAIKFSNTGSILVRVDVENADSHSALLKCSVSDTGVGIRRSQLNRDLFNAFSQAGNTPQQRSGAGLGLAISKKLVDQMGGDIGMDSEENVGSTFWFTIRLDVDHSHRPLETAPGLQGRHILLFDTSAASRQSFVNLLTEHGAQLSLTQGVADILPALSSNSHASPDQWFSAVLISIPVDIQNFPIDRLGELVRQARRFCPVVVATSTTLRHYLETRLPPQTCYLNKPASRNKLLDALATCGLAAEPGDRPSATDAVAATDNCAAVNSGQLLVVDDQPTNLRLLSHLLRDLGHQVQEARNGREALTLCEETVFDCVFMDIRMPEMDGVEATRRIRQLNNGNRHTPVIAVTAQAMSDQKRQLLLSGLDDYLSKPLQETQLHQILQRWLATPAASALERQEPVTIHKCVDIEQCLTLSHGKTSLAMDMLQMLLADLPAHREEINAALSGGRYAEARELVHRLHGACCYCGVPELRNACKQLEQHLARSASAPTTDDCQAFNRAVNALLQWQEQHELQDLFG